MAFRPDNRSIKLMFSGPADNANHYDSFGQFDVLSSQSHYPNDHNALQGKLVRIHEGWCTVIDTPQDGNCMFAAFAHQLFRHPIHSATHGQLTRCLRWKAVEYLAKHMHDQTIINLMNDRMDSDFPRLRSHPTTLACNHILSELSRDAVWGGLECLTALSRLFACTIVTYWENGPTTLINNAEGANERIDVI